MSLSTRREAIRAFLEEEADRLDSGDLAGWLELCTEGSSYWMPVSSEQTDPHHEISLLYENRTLMELRVRNFGHRLAPSFETPVRCSHLIGRIRIRDDTPPELEVTARFHCVMWYRNEQRIFAGDSRYDLLEKGGSFRIRRKRVDLLNADASHKSIPIYL